MAVMLERWNDERMDGLEGKVDNLGGKVGALEGRVGALEGKVDSLSDLMREQRQETRDLRLEMKAGFDQMHRTLLNMVIGLTSGFLAGFAALIVALH